MSEQPNAIHLAKMSDINAHTPGPWALERSRDSLAIIAPRKGCKRNGKINSWEIAAVGSDCFWDDKSFYREDVANARLISCAPQLLAALQGLLAVTDDPANDADPEESIFAFAREVIARATTP